MKPFSITAIFKNAFKVILKKKIDYVKNRQFESIIYKKNHISVHGICG